MTIERIAFEGQVAVITAGGGGIGRATALMLAARGARLIVNDINPDAARNVVEEIEADGGEAVAEYSAVGTGGFAADIVDCALASFGRLDILVNNAGISRPMPFGEDSDEQIAEVSAVNFMGPYKLMRAVWPIMRAQNYGRILNTSSSAAIGSGISGAYAPTKAALIGLTKEAAICGAPLGILINALMPSACTPLLNKHPDPAFRSWMAAYFPAERVAALSAYLVSAASRANGEIFTAGGGMVSRVAFVRAEGHSDPQLTPEGVRDHIDDILDLSSSTVLGRQQDLQEIYFAAFPKGA